MNDANKIMEGAKSRLVALANNRPFRFIDTNQEDAERYLTAMRSYSGLTEEEISNLEANHEIKFPFVFRSFLQYFGTSRGHLFRGSDASPGNYAKYKKWAEELLRENGISSFLTEKAFVFLFHQGYSFLFFYSEAKIDLPIYQYVEGADKPQIIADSFANFLDSTLKSMEKVNQDQRANGGYFLSIRDDGWQKETHPARNSSIRPIDKDDKFINTKKSGIRRWLRLLKYRKT